MGSFDPLNVSYSHLLSLEAVHWPLTVQKLQNALRHMASLSFCVSLLTAPLRHPVVLPYVLVAGEMQAPDCVPDWRPTNSTGASC